LIAQDRGFVSFLYCQEQKWAGATTGNARSRDELLDGEVFYTLRETHIVIESWRRHCALSGTYLDRLPTSSFRGVRASLAAGRPRNRNQLRQHAPARG
jgi:hypothetical protein